MGGQIICQILVLQSLKFGPKQIRLCGQMSMSPVLRLSRRFVIGAEHDLQTCNTEGLLLLALTNQCSSAQSIVLLLLLTRSLFATFGITSLGIEVGLSRSGLLSDFRTFNSLNSCKNA